MEILVFIVGTIVAIILFGVIGKKMADKRRNAIAEFASQRGFQFFPDRDSSIASRFSHFGSFTQGKNRYGFNTFRGFVTLSNGNMELIAGDYHYETESRDAKGRTQRFSHYFSYLALQPPFVMRPRMSMRRETLADRIKGAIGFDDIDFEHDGFSRKFHVTSDDRKFCYDLLDPRMIEWIMTTEPPNLYIAGGQFLVTWKRRWTPDDFGKFIDWLNAFVDKMPSHLIIRLQNATPPSIPPPPLPMS